MLKSILKAPLSCLLYSKLYHIPIKMVYITTQDPNYVVMKLKLFEIKNRLLSENMISFWNRRFGNNEYYPFY